MEDFIIKSSYEKSIEISSSKLYGEFNDFMTKFNFKCQFTLTKFMMDLKKLDGIENKRTKTQRLIVIDIGILKNCLHNKYKIEFSENEDDEVEEEKSPLDF